MKKRILTTLLCLIMVLTLLPATTFAGTPSTVWIAGVELTSENPYYHNGANGAAGTANNIEAGSSAFHDVANNTLTLTGLNVVNSTALSVRDSGTAQYAITTEGSLTIILNGENSISVPSYTTALRYSESYPLAVLGDLTIQPGTSGSGSLTVQCNNAGTYVTEGMASCFAVLVSGTLEVTSGVTLTATVNGTATGNDAKSYGVLAGEINVTGGNLYATAGTATGGSAGNEFGESYGIMCYFGNLTVTSGRVRATGGVASGAEARSFGTFTQNAVDLSGGNFTAKSGNATSKGATNTAPVIGAGLTATASTSNDGNNPVSYAEAAHATYNWVSVYDPATVREVLVNPASVSVEKGGKQTFNANVIGENAPSQVVTWSISGNTSASTTINSSGVLLVGSDETAPSLTVSATSVEDTTKSSTATVTILQRFQIIQGANGGWTKGSESDLSFTADGNYDDFTGVMVDGETISDDNYESQSGSTIVALNADYLRTLREGRHTIRINYTGGYAETQFRIASIPATDDNANLILWACIAALSIAGIGAIIANKRKKDNE